MSVRSLALSIRTVDDPDVREADRLCEAHAMNAQEELPRLPSSHQSEDVVHDKQGLLKRGMRTKCGS